jgi:hypothetical protein
MLGLFNEMYMTDTSNYYIKIEIGTNISDFVLDLLPI